MLIFRKEGVRMKTDHQSHVFGLDIGTRSVVGLLLRNTEASYEVLDVEIEEHSERSMVDGQIHNVLAVTKVISSIKEKLEKKHGPLKKVCVAAAGRSLKTRRAKIEVDIAKKPTFEHQDILHLELSAVQKAQFEIAQEYDGEKSINYFCVGYSVLSYHLDGEDIGSLIDQKGHTAAVEVIATFLPKVVVDSLLAALNRSGLELEALTLEPIAAINVLIPPSMRRLNVALVDIGAGTSDIAITDLGTVTAYGMVPVAGDEITEAISDHFLLDFPEAEEVKRKISQQEAITLNDILGFETTYSKEEIVTPITDAIENLAQAIASEILNLNKKPPKAVMLVGGGSMTPNLTKHIAAALQLPENRVAIRGIDAIKTLEIPKDFKAGPELVTPIGIAIAAKESPVEYLSVKVNNQTIRLFDIKKLTIGDGLLAAGIDLGKLYGKPGMAMMVKVNGRLISIPGEHGSAPTLIKNGQASSLDDRLQDGDEIFVERGKSGQNAFAKISDVVETLPHNSITINGQDYQVEALIYRNGKRVTISDELQDRDEIEFSFPTTIEEILIQLDLKQFLQALKPFFVTINNKKISVLDKNGILKNGVQASGKSTIRGGDRLIFKTRTDQKLPLAKVLVHEDIPFNHEITVLFNGEKVNISKPLVEVIREEEPLDIQSLVNYGDELTIKLKEKQPFIFQDVFRFVDFNLTVQENKKLVILRNENNAEFSTPIHTGDSLEIKWVEKTNSN